MADSLVFEVKHGTFEFNLFKIGTFQTPTEDEAGPAITAFRGVFSLRTGYWKSSNCETINFK